MTTDIADRFFDAAASNDLSTVRALYAEDARIWHNWDELDQTVEENLATLAGIPRRYDSFEYADVRCIPLPDGFLRQHVIVASRDGRTARVPAIIRGYVADDLIYRIEEYFDRGQLAAALSTPGGAYA